MVVADNEEKVGSERREKVGSERREKVGSVIDKSCSEAKPVKLRGSGLHSRKKVKQNDKGRIKVLQTEPL